MTMDMMTCTGVSKSFTCSVGGSDHFQDYVLLRALKPKRWTVRAVDDVSFSVRSGEWVGLYGPNGCGKTTLLKLVAGLLTPDRGTITCCGSVSCFFTLGAGFHDDKKAVENILMHGLLHGLSHRNIRAKTDAIISFAGLDSHRDLPFKYLSTGMRARLAFSAAVHIESDLYMFDEALAVGDASFRIACTDRFTELKNKGKTGIVVDHSLAPLEQVCDRILCMESGRIVREAALSPSVWVH